MKVKTDLGGEIADVPLCVVCGEAITGFVVLCEKHGAPMHEDPCRDLDDPCSRPDHGRLESVEDLDRAYEDETKDDDDTEAA